MQIQKNVELAKYTSWQVGGPAEYFCEPQNLDDLKLALKFSFDNKIEITVLGGGTNVLISDKGIQGLVICLKKFTSLNTELSQDKSLVISCLSGTAKADLLKIFLKHKLAPALFLAGLPGDVGGGIVMNAGVAENFTPREFVEIVDWFEVLNYDGKDFLSRIYHKNDVKWSYRHSAGWGPGIITRVQLSWPLEIMEDVLDRVREANRLRLTKQPLDLPSCGSVFVNPVGHKAAQLIDQCGLKGYTVNGAQVSLKHANFIVNLGGARACDIVEIIRYVQDTVKQKTGVELKTEVIKLGLW